MLVKCKECDGKGFVEASIDGAPIRFSCTTCKGKGGFDVPDNKELCPVCNGKGAKMVSIMGLNVDQNCEKCFGTGMVDKK